MDDVIFRSFAFDLASRDAGAQEAMDACCIRCVLSTDSPVRVRGPDGEPVMESLDHSPACVDLTRFPLPCVEDHSPARTAIAVAENPQLVDGKLHAVMRFGSQSRAQEVLADVRGGIIRSLSIGYQRRAYAPSGPNAIKVTAWTPTHVSPVGEPADPGALFIRSKEKAMTEPAPIPKVDDAAVRAAVSEIAKTAESLGLRTSDYISLPVDDARSKMLSDVAGQRAAAMATPKAPAVTSLSVDESEKHRDAIVEAYSARCGQKASNLQGNPYAGKGLASIGRRYARQIGVRGAEDWEAKESAEFVLGKRDAGNNVLASFPNFVLGTTITRIVGRGFEQNADSLVFPKITEKQMVPDFRQFSVGGMGTGNLQKTAENVPFPELAKVEGYYNSTVKMWGGTLSVSLQALINDDTNAFDRSLRQAGLQANKTIERRVIQKLLMGTSTSEATSTWTSNTTSGCSPVFTTADTLAAARAKIGLGPAALMAKVGLDGNPLNNMTRYFLAGPTSGQYLAALKAQAGGQAVGNGFGAIPDLLVSAHLESSTLTGNSTSSYYCLAGPEVTGLVLSMISGYDTPQVEAYDMAATAALGWKVWLPFEADLWNVTNGAGTVIIPGAQQATT